MNRRRPMAHVPEPLPELGWSLVFAVILAALFAWALVAGVLAVGGPAS
jgi:hypothetical protein